ncbi:MAG: ribonuclease III [Pseudomonadota bacterium]
MDPRNSTTVPFDLSPEQESALDRLEANLGHVFNDRSLLVTALRHRSFVHQLKEASLWEQDPADNQRLEFLGDAVLSLMVSTLLYHEFPDLKEGLLSRMRAGLVNEGRLADMARQINLDQALLLGRGEEVTGGRDKNSILADALEAVVAAVYLDAGFASAMSMVENLWGELIRRSFSDDFLKDFKTKLQETTQRLLGQTPEYRLTASAGPDHDRVFEVALFLYGRQAGTGRGRSKKEAEQEAAREVLEKLDEGEITSD